MPDQYLTIVRVVERPELIRNRLFQAFDRESSRERVVLSSPSKRSFSLPRSLGIILLKPG